jgi:hypothetical protein
MDQGPFWFIAMLQTTEFFQEQIKQCRIAITPWGQWVAIDLPIGLQQSLLNPCAASRVV